MGQRFSSAGKSENTIEAAGLDGLDCLASELGLNSTPFGMDSIYLKSRLQRSRDLDGLDNANSITSFKDSDLRGRE